MSTIGRRELIAGVGSALAACPLSARAQAKRLTTIGFLGTSSATVWAKNIAAFTQRLSEHRWVDGRTVAMAYRWAEGRQDLYSEFAAEFVKLKVDVIVSSGGAVPALRRATTSIPIVFAVANDPLGMGLVASLARPGGNVTGLSNQATDLGGKKLEILRESIPGLRSVAVMANARFSAAMQELEETKAAARKLGLEVVSLGIEGTADLVPAIEAVAGRTQSLYVVSDGLMMSARGAIVAAAIAARLPTMHSTRDYVEAGGLMSYGPSYPAMFRRTADIVDKILRGTKPGDVPVEQPTRFEFVINMKTAKALGIEVPPMMLVRADEVIE